jgi:hypothetical protein
MDADLPVFTLIVECIAFAFTLKLHHSQKPAAHRTSLESRLHIIIRNLPGKSSMPEG